MENQLPVLQKWNHRQLLKTKGFVEPSRFLASTPHYDLCEGTDKKP